MNAKNIFFVVLMLLALLMVGAQNSNMNNHKIKRSSLMAMKRAKEFAVSDREESLNIARDNPMLLLRAITTNIDAPEK